MSLEKSGIWCSVRWYIIVFDLLITSSLPDLICNLTRLGLYPFISTDRPDLPLFRQVEFISFYINRIPPNYLFWQIRVPILLLQTKRIQVSSVKCTLGFVYHLIDNIDVCLPLNKSVILHIYKEGVYFFLYSLYPQTESMPGQSINQT